MAAVASIQITVDEKSAVTAIKNLTNAIGQTEPALRRVGDAGNVVMTDLVKQHQQAHDAAILLGRTMGVELPRQLDTFLAKSQTIAPILAGAFNASIVIAFGAAAISALAKIPAAIEEVNEAMTHEKAAAETTAKAHEELNKYLADGAQQAAKFAEQMELIGKTGSERFAIQASNATAQLSIEETTLDNLKSQLDEQNRLLGIEEQRRQARANILVPVPPKSSVQNDLEAQITKQNAAIEDQKNKVAAASAAVMVYAANQQQAFGEERQKDVQDLTKQIDAQQKVIRQAIEQRAANYSDAVAQDQEFLASSRKELQAALDKEQADRDAINQNIAEGTVDYVKKQAAATADMRKEAEQQVKDQQHAAEEWTRTRDQLANSIDSFFRDLTSGNIGTAFLRQFEKMVSQMVATWLLGMNTMQAGTAATLGLGGGVPGIIGGGSGGILGNLFNAMGGGRSAGGAAAASSLGSGLSGGLDLSQGALMSDSQASALLGLPLSAGAGVSALSTLPAGASIGSGSAARSGGLGAIFGGGGGLSQLLSMGGLAGGAALLGSQNPILKMLGGAGLGFGIGSIAAPPFLGPIIGGISALFSLIGPKHQQDRHNWEMAELASITQITNSFQAGQTDYNSAVAALEQMRQQGDQQFSAWGASNHMADQVDSHINAAESDLAQKEGAIVAEQQRRAAIQFGPAQFGAGGFVGGPTDAPAWFAASAQKYAAGGDVVPAMLTPGEFVMRPEAVRQQGVSKLQAMNDGRAGGDHYHFTINALDARSFDQYLKGGGLATIRRNMAIARSEGRW